MKLKIKKLETCKLYKSGSNITVLAQSDFTPTKSDKNKLKALEKCNNSQW